MPKVKLHKGKGMGVPTEASKPSFPSVYIPASEEIVKALEVGGPVEVTLKGKVTALSISAERQEFNMEVHEVEAYPESGYEKMAKDDETDSED